MFRSELAGILCLLVGSHDAEFRADTGHHVAYRLSPFIAKVRLLLAPRESRPGWDSKAKAMIRMILADSLQVLADQSGQNESLERPWPPTRRPLRSSNLQTPSLMLKWLTPTCCAPKRSYTNGETDKEE